MNIFQIGVISVTSVLLALPLKHHKEEYSSFISIIVGILILFATLEQLVPVIEYLKQIRSYFMIKQEYIHILMKMVGVSYVSEFSSGLCKDAGYHSVGVQLEVLGKVIILVYSIPILLELLEMVRGLWL